MLPVKHAMLYGARDLRLESYDLEIAAMRPNDVYIETEVTALSTGTDLGNYLGRSTDVPDAPDYPRRVGYSNVGRVVRTGSEVQHLRPGMRVFSMRPHLSAYIAREDSLLVVVPDNVNSESASLAFLAELGLAALRQAQYQPGESIAVIGLGVIGLCTVGLARAFGARVVAVANSPLRADLALRLGADMAILTQDDDVVGRARAFCDGGVDIVVLTANSWAAYRTAVEIARVNGRVSVLGFPGRYEPHPDFNPLDPRWFYAKSLALFGAGSSPQVECDASDIRFNLRRNLQCVMDLMATGRFKPELIISHRLAAERMKDAYEMAALHDKALACAIFDWRTGADTNVR